MGAPFYRYGNGHSQARAPLRIGIFNWRDVRHPKAGGAEEYLYRQALEWIRQGHEVKWFAANFAGGRKRERIDGIDVYRGGGEFTTYAAAPFSYWRHMRDCDVLLDAENGIPFFTPLFSARPKVLLMYHVHRDVLLRELPKPVNYIGFALEAWIMPAVYRRVPVVAISESTKEDIQRYRYTRRPITIVHSGVDHQLLRPGAKAQVPTIAYVGRVVRYKRVRELIETFGAVRGAIPQAQLILAGTGGDADACRKRAAELGLQDAVRFEGFVTNARKRAILAQAWTFAHCSEIEGWGISIIEAAACGTPSVAMRVPGLRDAVIDGTTGLLVDSFSEMKDALVRVLRDTELRARLSDNAVLHSQNFSWEKSANRMLAVLQEAMTA